MSAGNFRTVGYASENTGLVHPIRVQPETADLQLSGVSNDPASGSLSLPSAVVSRGRRAKGINARTVTIKFEAGDQPTGYKADSPITLPWFENSAAFLNAVPGGTAVTYLGQAAVLVGKSPETVR